MKTLNYKATTKKIKNRGITNKPTKRKKNGIKNGTINKWDK